MRYILIILSVCVSYATTGWISCDSVVNNECIISSTHELPNGTYTKWYSRSTYCIQVTNTDNLCTIRILKGAKLGQIDAGMGNTACVLLNNFANVIIEGTIEGGVINIFAQNLVELTSTSIINVSQSKYSGFDWRIDPNIGGAHINLGGYACIWDNSYTSYPWKYDTETRPYMSGSASSWRLAGGGKIHIQSPVVIANGIIESNGGVDENVTCDSGGASGGSILIDSDNITGNGYMYSKGGDNNRYYKSCGTGGGAGGSVAIYSAVPYIGTIDVSGGSSSTSCSNAGGIGTIYQHCNNITCNHGNRTDICGKCNCDALWAGVFCDMAEYSCVYGKTTADSPCECYDGWTGISCDTCVDNIPCRFNGVCNLATGRCMCHNKWNWDSWYGRTCKYRCDDSVCPSYKCGFNGTCDGSTDNPPTSWTCGLSNSNPPSLGNPTIPINTPNSNSPTISSSPNASPNVNSPGSPSVQFVSSANSLSVISTTITLLFAACVMY